MRGGGKGALRIAVAKAALADDVALRAGMENRRVRRRRGERIDHRRQWAITDFDEIERILGAVAVGGDHDGDRFADVTHAIDGDRPALDRGLDADRETRGERLDFGAGEHGKYAVRRQRRRAIDRLDFGVRMRRAQNGGFERAGAHAQIVDIAAAAGEQRRVLDPRDRAADPARCGRRDRDGSLSEVIVLPFSTLPQLEARAFLALTHNPSTISPGCVTGASNDNRSRDAIRARAMPKPKHLVTTGLDPVVHADLRLRELIGRSDRASRPHGLPDQVRQ